jgi:hypothetical protein
MWENLFNRRCQHHTNNRNKPTTVSLALRDHVLPDLRRRWYVHVNGNARTVLQIRNTELLCVKEYYVLYCIVLNYVQAVSQTKCLNSDLMAPNNNAVSTTISCRCSCRMTIQADGTNLLSLWCTSLTLQYVCLKCRYFYTVSCMYFLSDIELGTVRAYIRGK